MFWGILSTVTSVATAEKGGGERVVEPSDGGGGGLMIECLDLRNFKDILPWMDIVLFPDIVAVQASSVVSPRMVLQPEQKSTRFWEIGSCEIVQVEDVGSILMDTDGFSRYCKKSFSALN